MSCFSDRWIEANTDQTSDSKVMFLELQGSVINTGWRIYEFKKYRHHRFICLLNTMIVFHSFLYHWR
mgnify:CR=1 FL=1